MTRNWTAKRKIAFWTHLIYILIPALAALVAAVRLWTFIFGEWYFAVPLILCLEGVATVGFWFHLTKVDSPFVKARHFIPFFSVGTLGYELGAYLVAKHSWELGVPFTVFVVGVFGFLFIKSFGVLERLMIDPVQAAAEKATEQAQGILVPVEEHNARARVYREFADRLRAAEQGQAVQPQLTLDDVRGLLEDMMAAHVLQPAYVAPRVAEPTQIGFYGGPVPTDAAMLAVSASELATPTRLTQEEVERIWQEVQEEAGAKKAVQTASEVDDRLNEPMASIWPEAITEASEEDRTDKGQDFGEVIVAAVADGIAWLDRNVAEVLDEKLAEVGLDRQGALALLQQYNVKSATDAYRGLRMLGKLPKGISERDFEVLYAELTNPKPAGVPCRGEDCSNTLNNGQKGVAAKWANRRGLGDLILCSACRAKHPSN